MSAPLSLDNTRILPITSDCAAMSAPIRHKQEIEVVVALVLAMSRRRRLTQTQTRGITQEK